MTRGETFGVLAILGVILAMVGLMARNMDTWAVITVVLGAVFICMAVLVTMAVTRWVG